VTGDRYAARRDCPQCQRETEVSLQVLPDVIKMDCSECWGSFELPRVDPGR
jgi:Zn ribbon nucleic-acid-binding protein